MRQATGTAVLASEVPATGGATVSSQQQHSSTALVLSSQASPTEPSVRGPDVNMETSACVETTYKERQVVRPLKRATRASSAPAVAAPTTKSWKRWLLRLPGMPFDVETAEKRSRSFWYRLVYEVRRKLGIYQNIAMRGGSFCRA